jgi:gamma-glutamyltranspeptidase/glutathione hydrolase
MQMNETRADRLAIVETIIIHAFCLAALLLAAAAPVRAAPSSTAEGEHGMVVSAQHEASAAGLRILQAGGNAVDAAVAVGYALAVVDPCCGNIGGGGFMLVHTTDGRDSVINFRETAPRAARSDMFLDSAGNPVRERSLYGYLAAGVPGTVMGLDHALSKYGRLGRAAVMAPAIGLARDGFVLGEPDAAIIAARAERLAKDPEAARLFLHPDRSPFQRATAWHRFAATLGLIAERGPTRSIAARSPPRWRLHRRRRAASWPKFRRLHGKRGTAGHFFYRRYTILSAPPPSAGGTIL